MSDLRDLYQDVIFDHYKKPRNFHAMTHANHVAHGHNRLCGDELTIYLHVNGDVIEDVSFEGAGCAISTASASLMTDALKNRTVEEAEHLFEQFHHLLTHDDAEPAPDLGKLEVLAGVREFPARVKCATLAWHTLQAALKDRAGPITTEQLSIRDSTMDLENANAGQEATIDEEALRNDIVAVLRTIYDPEISVNIYDLGLIYLLDIGPEGAVQIEMTLTAPACPVAGTFPSVVEERVAEVPGVKSVHVELVWEPPWSIDSMTDEVKLELGLL